MAGGLALRDEEAILRDLRALLNGMEDLLDLIERCGGEFKRKQSRAISQAEVLFAELQNRYGVECIS